MAEANKGPWIIAGAILAGTLLVVGFLWWSSGADCRNWQKDVSSQFAEVKERFPYMNLDNPHLWTSEQRAAVEGFTETGEDRPAGCDYPDE